MLKQPLYTIEEESSSVDDPTIPQQHSYLRIVCSILAIISSVWIYLAILWSISILIPLYY
jgi:hypothetical protein